MAAVGGDEHRFKTAEQPVGPPEFGQFGRRAKQVVGVVAELGLEPFQERESISGASGEPTRTFPSRSFRTFTASDFMTVVPSVT